MFISYVYYGIAFTGTKGYDYTSLAPSRAVDIGGLTSVSVTVFCYGARNVTAISIISTQFIRHIILHVCDKNDNNSKIYFVTLHLYYRL